MPAYYLNYQATTTRGGIELLMEQENLGRIYVFTSEFGN